jgi:putative copper export protein
MPGSRFSRAVMIVVAVVVVVGLILSTMAMPLIGR